MKPLSDNIITTGNRYDEVYSSGGILDPNKSGSFKEYQTVLFSSDAAVSRGVNVGDTVLINFYNYARAIQKRDSVKSDMDEQYSQQLAFSIPTIDIDKKECLHLRASDIQLVILEMVDEENITKSNGSFKVKQPKIIKN